VSVCRRVLLLLMLLLLLLMMVVIVMVLLSWTVIFPYYRLNWVARYKLVFFHFLQFVRCKLNASLLIKIKVVVCKNVMPSSLGNFSV